MKILNFFFLNNKIHGETFYNERPGLESQRSQERLFFRRKISNSLQFLIYVLFYNNNSKKYYESKENRGAMVIIPSGLKIFRS